MDWAARLEIVPELLTQAKEIKSVKITLIGRPGRVVEKGAVMLTSMQQGSKAPSLPKGLPPVPEEPTVYIVYITRKQWRKVAKAIRNPEDVLIVEGLPVLDNGWKRWPSLPKVSPPNCFRRPNGKRRKQSSLFNSQ
jgi:hypothetical protein